MRLVEGKLICVECGLTEDGFCRGWRGFLTDDEYAPAEVAILCPDCAWREFGSRQLRLNTDQGDEP
jgi:hypothetical protein